MIHFFLNFKYLRVKIIYFRRGLDITHADINRNASTHELVQRNGDHRKPLINTLLVYRFPHYLYTAVDLCLKAVKHINSLTYVVAWDLTAAMSLIPCYLNLRFVIQVANTQKVKTPFIYRSKLFLVKGLSDYQQRYSKKLIH